MSDFQVLKFTEQGAFFFSQPKELLISYKTSEVPVLLGSLDRARSAGMHVAGFLSYEALHEMLGLEKKSKKADSKNSEQALHSHKASGPLLAFGLFSEYEFIFQKKIYGFLDRLAGAFAQKNPCFLSKKGVPGDFTLSEILPEGLAGSAFEDGFRPFYSLQDRLWLSRALKAEEAQKRVDFFEAFANIKRELKEGNSYQINYTQKKHYRFLGNPVSLFSYLYRLQPSQEAALCLFKDYAILCLSPEIFLDIRGPVIFEADKKGLSEKNIFYKIQTRPMKGTAPRSGNQAEDVRISQQLSSDPKTRAENLMIVDLLRNDLGRIAKIGSVCVPRLFAKESHPSLHQMTSQIEALISEKKYNYFFSEILPALFPSGSVTGAPKLASMKIIQRLEEQGRGAYTGSLGYALSSQRTTSKKNSAAGSRKGPPQSQELVNFNVLIRSFELDLKKRQADYGAGCGIVHDSRAEAEWNELLLKQAFYLPVLSHFHLIETMRLENGRIPLLELHLERLENALQTFVIVEEAKVPALLSYIKKTIFSFSDKKPLSEKNSLFRLRLCVRRGGEVHLSRHPLPQKEHGLRLCLAQEQVFSGNPFRSYKTSIRESYDTALSQARLQGFDDALFLNERGEVVESAIANLLFLDQKGRWSSPAPECGALPGVFLRHLSLRHEICFRKVCLPELLQSQRVYLSNALFGLRRVASIFTQKGDLGAIKKR